MMKRFLTAVLTCLVLVTPALAQNDPVAAMTLEQKVAQMFMVTLHGSVMTEVGAAFLREWQPGGVVLFAANVTSPEGATRLTNDFQRTMTEAGAPPLLIAIDQEGGVVQRLTEGFTTIPVPMLVGAAGDEMAYQMGELVGEELSAVGINMNLAPVADLEVTRDNPIIDRRTYGSDPNLAGQAAAQVVRGLQSRNVIATLKHFPGHGPTTQDSHAVLQAVELDRERLDSVEMAAFRPGIEAGAGAVMVAHIWYPALDPERRPATLSPEVVTGVLREELGFDGLIVTDAMDMNAVDMEVNFARSMVLAVQAGVDLMTLGPSFGLPIAEQSIQAVVNAVRNGEISEARIDESVRRILAAKEQFGVMDWTPLDVAGTQQRLNLEAHAATIEELYRQGVTVALDRNDLIPLTPDRKIAILFLGTRYQIYDECRQYNPDIRWLAISDAPDSTEIAYAVDTANWSDTTVVFTQNAVETVEQQNLVNALPQEKTVAVAIWSPYDWQTYPNVAGYVVTYSPARPAIPAACAVLFGALPANGRLSIALGEALPAGSRDETP